MHTTLIILFPYIFNDWVSNWNVRGYLGIYAFICLYLFTFFLDYLQIESLFECFTDQLFIHVCLINNVQLIDYVINHSVNYKSYWLIDWLINNSSWHSSSQLRSVPVSEADDEELEKEAEWIYKQAFFTPSVSNQVRFSSAIPKSRRTWGGGIEHLHQQLLLTCGTDFPNQVSYLRLLTSSRAKRKHISWREYFKATG